MQPEKCQKCFYVIKIVELYTGKLVLKTKFFGTSISINKIFIQIYLHLANVL